MLGAWPYEWRYSPKTHIVPRAAIIVLFDPCSPATIPRLVIAVVVDAIDGVFRARPWPHIGQEVFELSPTLTHGDPAATPIFIVLRIGIIAAPAQLRPTLILRGVLASFTLAMLNHALTPLSTASFSISARTLSK